jgi:Trichodiene synthase (TRI5)
MTKGMTKENIKVFLERFLEEMNFDLAQPVKRTDKILEERATQMWNTYVLDSTFNSYGLKSLSWGGTRFSHLLFPNHPLELKVYCALYTLFHILIDPQDHAGIYKIAICDLESFVLRFANAKEMTHPLLEPLARFFLTETPLLFSPMQTVGLFKSSMDYFFGCLCEQKFPQGVPSYTEEFPPWLRYKTGLGEAYGHFFLSCVEKERRDNYLPVVPLIAEYINYVNDILSIYKEHCDSEEHNYASYSSQALSSSTNEVMTQLGAKVKEIKRRIERFCAENGLLDFSSKLIHGYIAWHITEERYRLGEIGIVMTNQIDDIAA